MKIKRRKLEEDIHHDSVSAAFFKFVCFFSCSKVKQSKAKQSEKKGKKEKLKEKEFKKSFLAEEQEFFFFNLIWRSKFVMIPSLRPEIHFILAIEFHWLFKLNLRRQRKVKESKCVISQKFINYIGISFTKRVWRWRLKKVILVNV